MGDRIDVNAARGNICRDQHPGVPILEVLKRSLSGVLRFVAVNGLGANASVLELASHLVGAVLGACEDDGSRDIIVTQQVLEHPLFLSVVDHDDPLVDLVHGHFLRRHVHTNGVMEQLASERGNLFRHGGGEQKRLTAVWRLRYDALHVAYKSHVEKPVGLIEHEDRHFGKIDVPLGCQIQQAAGSRDEHVETLGQTPDLRILTDAANDERVTQLGVSPNAGQFLMNL